MKRCRERTVLITVNLFFHNPYQCLTDLIYSAFVLTSMDGIQNGLLLTFDGWKLLNLTYITQKLNLFTELH